MEADLAALRAEIRTNNLFLALVFGSVPVLAVAFLLMWMAA
jgi:nitrate reductase NapE component